MDLDDEELEATRRLHKTNKKENIIKEYILGLLRLQKTKLKCINLGFNPSKIIKVELDLIEEAQNLINNKL